MTTSTTLKTGEPVLVSKGKNADGTETDTYFASVKFYRGNTKYGLFQEGATEKEAVEALLHAYEEWDPQ